ncbi:MAG: hypothetical protein ACYSUQ_05085, partial [Planctomycetota bacterium]
FERTRRVLGSRAATFVLAPQWEATPFYRLHVEEGMLLSSAQTDRLAAEMEQQLRSANIEYGCKRDSQRLGALRVNLLPAGFLARLEAKLAARCRGRQEQYKHCYLFPRPGDDADFPISAPQRAQQPVH